MSDHVTLREIVTNLLYPPRCLLCGTLPEATAAGRGIFLGAGGIRLQGNTMVRPV